MKTYIIMALTVLALTQLSYGAGKPDRAAQDNKIRHTVFFLLKHPTGSMEEKNFLKAARQLARIPTVKNFQCLREVSKKNDFTFGLSMEFDDQAAYETYNKHPDHVKFVREIWMKEVKDFMEIDYVLIPAKAK